MFTLVGKHSLNLFYLNCNTMTMALLLPPLFGKYVGSSVTFEWSFKKYDTVLCLLLSSDARFCFHSLLSSEASFYSRQLDAALLLGFLQRVCLEKWGVKQNQWDLFLGYSVVIMECFRK